MLKAYKYRLCPNKSQELQLRCSMGCVRYIYNKGLETKVKTYQTSGKFVSCFDLINNMLQEEKKENEWLSECYSQSLQSALRNLDVAFTSFFRKNSKFPKFKSKKSKQSIQYPQHVKVDFEKSKIFLPKTGWVNITLHRKFKGKIKTVTVSRTPTEKFFVSILIENDIQLPEKPQISRETSVGIDLGIKNFITLSDSTKIDNPQYLENNIIKLQKLSRKHSKKKKGSNNRKKLSKKLAKLHEKIANQRKDFLHKTSSKIISENQTIILEDLNVSGMIQNHFLARKISDCAWSMFVGFLEYKAEWYGKNIIKIGRFDPSSKTCFNCGNIYKELKLNERTWECSKCLAKHDRDINAALNIKRFGLIKIGLGQAEFKPLEKIQSLQEFSMKEDAHGLVP